MCRRSDDSDRAAAAPGPSDDWTGLQPGVISRMRAETDEAWTSRMRRTFDDMHLVWIGLASTIATILCAAVALYNPRWPGWSIGCGSVPHRIGVALTPVMGVEVVALHVMHFAIEVLGAPLAPAVTDTHPPAPRVLHRRPPRQYFLRPSQGTP